MVDDSEQRVEIYSLIKEIRETLSNEEILDLFVSMWEVIMIDGIVDDYESALMRKLVGLS